MGRNWAEQPRDERGRWTTDKPRKIRLDLRLDSSMADLLLILTDEYHMTKTALIDAALRAFQGGFPPEKPVQTENLTSEFAKHRAQLARRKRRRV